MTENEADEEQQDTEIDWPKFPLTLSTVRLPNRDLQIHVRDSRNERDYEFLYSNMKKFLRTNIPILDESWKCIVDDIRKTYKSKETVYKEKKLNIFYSYYKIYDEGSRGVIRAKTIDGIDNPREFYKEIEANTETAKGVYWIHKDIFLELNNLNVDNITFHLTNLFHAKEDDGMDYIRECAFFEIRDFIEHGYYKGNKIYIREEDIDRSITFKNNEIKYEKN